MRTTVDLPDELVRAAKVWAAQRDESLKDVFARALARELEGSTRKIRGELPVIATSRRADVAIGPDELEQALIGDDVDRLP